MVHDGGTYYEIKPNISPIINTYVTYMKGLSWNFKLPLTTTTTDSVCTVFIASIKLNVPKCQCSFTLFRTACIVGGVTSRFLSQVFLNI